MNLPNVGQEDLRGDIGGTPMPRQWIMMLRIRCCMAWRWLISPTARATSAMSCGE